VRHDHLCRAKAFVTALVARSAKAISTKTMTIMIRNIGIAARAAIAMPEARPAATAVKIKVLDPCHWSCPC